MIELKNIHKTWQNDKISLLTIEDINLSINKGEFISIIGPSGCGKTTLLKLIAGLLEPTKGQILLNDKATNQKSPQRLSIVFQNPILLPWRKIKENIQLPNELNNLPLNKNVYEKIHLVGLQEFENNYPDELSGGMQQRVAIARALILNPTLLLMDEPFSSLDEVNRNRLNLELLKIWKELRPTIIFVTHSISDAVFLSDRIIILTKRPAKVKEILSIDLPRSRKLEIKETLEFQRYVKWIRERIE
ncbi:ABC transporter ATP-binding protein [Candidatus Woesearchaeota archaeon]|nr:ABC transporter ATP-binding protein [Candidatus Woesearchaeota archaeon]